MKTSSINRLSTTIVLCIAAVASLSYAQDSDAIDHAKKIVQLSQQEKFEEITAEFDAQMAAVVTAGQMKQQWAALKAQLGDFKSFIDHKVATPSAGITVVTLGCQFEKNAINIAAVFDSEN